MKEAVEIKCVYTDLIPVEELTPHPRNSNTHPPEQLERLAYILVNNGWRKPINVSKQSGYVVAGHGTLEAAILLGLTQVPVDYQDYASGQDEIVHMEADNKIAQMAIIDLGQQKDNLEYLNTGAIEMLRTGFDDKEIELLMLQVHQPDAEVVAGNLAKQFIAPPLSVLDARQGYWQERKRTWLALGIQSGTGRQDDLISKNVRSWQDEYASSTVDNVWAGSGTSIFDPVLCEIMYAWFNIKGGSILDPFAGGSVRGMVAVNKGYKYTGVDISKEQVAANYAQLGGAADNMPALTPVQTVDQIKIKRDDLFTFAGMRGGKVRTCLALSQGATGLVTAGSRKSPQVAIVARIAERLGIPCTVHTPNGDMGAELLEAQQAGAEVKQHKAGYNSVIIKRARDYAAKKQWLNIPFGMECREAVNQTAQQVVNIPKDTARLVVPVGSGMSLAGVLHGLRINNLNIPVLGVQVGADPTKRLDEYAPDHWRDMVALVKSKHDYHHEVDDAYIGGILLDPIYEAKCLPYLQDGDLFWIVGSRYGTQSAATGKPNWVHGDSQQLSKLVKGKHDMIFTCPPYYDLEQYSDDPSDISNMPYVKFKQAYSSIAQQAVDLLKPNRFAVVVVADVRDKRGVYRNLVSQTIAAYTAAGLKYYNEGIFITPTGSLPMRAAKAFNAGRKFGKAHQNVLVFYKGDTKQIGKHFKPLSGLTAENVELLLGE